VAVLQDVLRWLDAHPLPPGGTLEFDRWLGNAAEIPQAWLASLVTALSDSETARHYTALIALRQHGYQAWGEGYGQDMLYRVTRPDGSVTVIASPEA
jgi:hypothetical protein